jgi:hypothetical protein
MFTKGNELTMSRDNISALVTTITVIVVISVIIGFTIYFSNPSLNQAWSEQQQQKDKGLVVGGVHSPELSPKNHGLERCSY